MKRIMMVITLSLSFALLTGCLYPEDKLTQNRVPYKQQLNAVQDAVNQYRVDNGVLPIQNRDQDTKKYIKYPIEFGKLVPRYLSEAPGNSFENGGVYQYVLVNVEKEPEVKLVDLEAVEQVKDYRMKLRLYRQKHKYPPYKDVLGNGRYTLKYKELGYKEQPVVKSRFSGNNLPLIVDGKNEVYIDYSMDLYQALQNKDHQYENGDDIRDILMEDSPFVPAYSVPYTVKDGEPVFLFEDTK
ncbi:hypothetical protein [Pseudalkalibacillus berkeleyi]|uniref:ABC transporter periplasmic binding protein yphF n=1 Tax=Pseudalkalibacillus berkeleyi TaxID=1069813 RepID=A0ABS9GXY5_9BACL|nr:hypothetical protein [Pseudalkalibacillus berkeleyi]MCF6137584.1 hypothetical protein [Pseudalkalibacillus berkeleyi]